MAGPVGAARDRLLNGLMDRFSTAGLPVLNEVRAEHGLAPLQKWNDQVLGARAIYVMTAPELDSLAEPTCRPTFTTSDPHSSHSRRSGNRPGPPRIPIRWF